MSETYYVLGYFKDLVLFCFAGKNKNNRNINLTQVKYGDFFGDFSDIFFIFYFMEG